MNFTPTDFTLPSLPWIENSYREYQDSVRRWNKGLFVVTGAASALAVFAFPPSIFVFFSLAAAAPLVPFRAQNETCRIYHSKVEQIFKDHIKRIDEIEFLALAFLRVLNEKTPNIDEERTAISQLHTHLMTIPVPCLRLPVGGVERYFIYHQEANRIRSQIWAWQIQKIQKLTTAIFNAITNLKELTEISKLTAERNAPAQMIPNFNEPPRYHTFLYNSPALGRRDAPHDELEIHCMMKKDQRRLVKFVILACGAQKPHANAEKAATRAAKEARNYNALANAEDRLYELYLQTALLTIRDLQEKTEGYRLRIAAKNLAMQLADTHAEIDEIYNPSLSDMDNKITVLERQWNDFTRM